MNIWAVCTYFNFTKCKYRLKNYQIFKKNIKDHDIKLLCVEFSPNGDFVLEDNDADVLIRLGGGDIMWQKERMLNIGIDMLPQNTDIVIIADTDIIFSSKNLVPFLQYEMSRYHAVQCFSTVSHFKPFVDIDLMNADFSSINITDDNIFMLDRQPGCMFAYETVANFQQGVSGYAWAFRYKTIKDIKLFEYNIIGGGDRITASAFMGLPVASPFVAGINSNIYFNYLKKIKDYGLTRNDISFIDQVYIYDLFHGFHKNRDYENRHKILKKHNFDAEKDLIGIPEQPFRFADHVNNDLKLEIINYFYSRNGF